MMAMINGNTGDRGAEALRLRRSPGCSSAPTHDDLTQEDRDNADGTESRTSTRVLETQGDHNDRRSPHGQDCTPGDFHGDSYIKRLTVDIPPRILGDAFRADGVQGSTEETHDAENDQPHARIEESSWCISLR